jgi:tRNA (guanosine-2'-O-)-methyltransferase
VVEIPMVGSGLSLNVAVAGSLVLYKLAGLI